MTVPLTRCSCHVQSQVQHVLSCCWGADQELPVPVSGSAPGSLFAGGLSLRSGSWHERGPAHETGSLRPAQGTAATEAEELYDRYGLRVVAIPTHRPCVRVDHDTRIYFSRGGKKRMLFSLIDESGWLRQPVLIGTSSVADSDQISEWLSEWRACTSVSAPPLTEPRALPCRVGGGWTCAARSVWHAPQLHPYCCPAATSFACST